MNPIYLDYNATTPLDPAVVDAMLPYLTHHFGNPSSSHAYGRTTRDAVAAARLQVAALLNAQAAEIVFTGGGSEASNQAIKGAFFAAPEQAHIVTSAVEHPATLEPCAFLRRLGCEITVLPVDRYGRVDPDEVRRATQRKTLLVSIMHSNNEVGTLQPIRAIAAIARERGALMHTDAAQSLGKLALDVNELGVDLLTMAGHKLYAPKGVGVLYARRGVPLEPLVHGAGHEGGRRAGTENVPYVAALGMACAIARQSLPNATQRLRGLRDRLWDRLSAALGERVTLNGHPEERLPNTLNVNVAGWIGSDLLKAVPEIAASTGSACHEGSKEITLSPVLAAMGVPLAIGRGALRLSVGRFTTEDDVDRAGDLLARAARTIDPS